jgi:hypothetical protein
MQSRGAHGDNFREQQELWAGWHRPEEERNTTVRKNCEASSAVITVIHDISFRGFFMTENAQTRSLGQ